MTAGKRAKNSATACVTVQQRAALIYVALSKRCGMQPKEGGIEKSCFASRNSAILVTASLRVYSSQWAKDSAGPTRGGHDRRGERLPGGAARQAESRTMPHAANGDHAVPLMRRGVAIIECNAYATVAPTHKAATNRSIKSKTKLISSPTHSWPAPRFESRLYPKMRLPINRQPAAFEMPRRLLIDQQRPDYITLAGAHTYPHFPSINRRKAASRQYLWRFNIEPPKHCSDHRPDITTADPLGGNSSANLMQIVSNASARRFLSMM